MRKSLDTSNHGKWKEFVELDLEKWGKFFFFGGGGGGGGGRDL